MSVEIRRTRDGRAAIYRAGTSERLFAPKSKRVGTIRRCVDFAAAQGWTVTKIVREDNRSLPTGIRS